MGWRLVAIVLLVLVAASPLCLRALALDSAQPAGCHFHTGQRTTLRTADHGCCQSGHDAALVEVAVTRLPVVTSTFDFERPAIFGVWHHSPITMTLSGGPPVFPPLLI